MRYPNTIQVREWLNARFHGIAQVGAIPRWGVEAWDKAHPKRKFVKEQAYHGTPGGYTNHGCRCIRCERARGAFYNVEREAA